MTVQATIRSPGNGEWAMLVRAALSLVSLVHTQLKNLFALFMAALEESRARESARILRRYRHLIDDSGE
jgi:hypothetical protein